MVARQNRDLASLGVVLQMATATTGMAAGRETFGNFKTLITELNGDD